METRTQEFGNQAKEIARDTKETIKQSASQIAEKARNLSASARDTAQATYEASREKVVAGAKATDEAIRANPYSALGVAFGAGLLIGWFLRRK